MNESVNKREIENEMAKWLEHPSEFGVAPKAVSHRRTYVCTIVATGERRIHLVEYEMPDGTKSRGFVNPPLTWSFIGDMSGISDDELLSAYCGWAWLFPRIQEGGGVLTSFTSEGEEARYVARKQAQAIQDFKIMARYKIGTSEIFEFTGVLDGKLIKGAGNTEIEKNFNTDVACFKLPPIYFLLGSQVIKSKR